MKLKALFIVFLISLCSSAFAQWFPARVFVNVHPGQVAIQVTNPFPSPIICSGEVFGQTSYGVVHNAFFVQQILRPGEFRYAYVHTAYAPFVNGWSNIHCRYATFW